MNLLEGLNFPDNTIDYLSNLFRSVREELHFTQEQMAQLLGTTQKVYQRWETGHREPTGEYVAKVFLIRDYLNNLPYNSLKFISPIDVAKKLAFRMDEQQDTELLLRDMAKPVILLVKGLLLYANAAGDSPKNQLSKPPFYIQWQPDTSGLLKAILLHPHFPRRELVLLEVYNVARYTNFNEVMILTYRPGQWVSVLQEALDLYKSYCYLGIDDQPMLSEMRAAFGLDKGSERTHKE